jgi:hypothetical protein
MRLDFENSCLNLQSMNCHIVLSPRWCSAAARPTPSQRIAIRLRGFIDQVPRRISSAPESRCGMSSCSSREAQPCTSSIATTLDLLIVLLIDVGAGAHRFAAEALMGAVGIALTPLIQRPSPPHSPARTQALRHRLLTVLWCGRRRAFPRRRCSCPVRRRRLGLRDLRAAR